MQCSAAMRASHCCCATLGAERIRWETLPCRQKPNAWEFSSFAQGTLAQALTPVLAYLQPKQGQVREALWRCMPSYRIDRIDPKLQKVSCLTGNYVNPTIKKMSQFDTP